ncbi:MAG: hypothetical protein S4CHLAM123_10460 [Chlamydiales bacterium]|nr:hypothetical protein [Chlamydiales bacterium]
MFRIRICSDLDHDEIVADICWNNNTIATINQDAGLENLSIELFLSAEHESWNLPFNDFMQTLLDAQKQLIEMKKKS